MLHKVIQAEGQIDILNLSGGEPTLNPNFYDIIEECICRKEILRVSVSTNGLALASNPDLLKFLVKRRVIISLQFDGLNDNIYVAMRGRPMLREKMQIIEACAELDASMSLTVTVVRGVNDMFLGDITQLFFKYPNILSLMFQPAAYAGSASRLGRPANAITLPDIIAGLNGAEHNNISSEDFSPLPCSHPACFSLAFYLKVGADQFQSIKQMVDADRYLSLIQNRAIFGTDAENLAQIQSAVYDLWSGPAGLSPDSQRAMKAVKNLLSSITAHGRFLPQAAFQVAERSIKSIFIHQFMDADTFDLSRARKCCQVYPQPDGRMIPACVRNCLHSNIC
jgi:uncharacterized radical SAM superfamily Fe-S cluster-containing enzyme